MRTSRTSARYGGANRVPNARNVFPVINKERFSLRQRGKPGDIPVGSCAFNDAIKWYTTNLLKFQCRVFTFFLLLCDADTLGFRIFQSLQHCTRTTKEHAISVSKRHSFDVAEVYSTNSSRRYMHAALWKLWSLCRQPHSGLYHIVSLWALQKLLPHGRVSATLDISRARFTFSWHHLFPAAGTFLRHILQYDIHIWWYASFSLTHTFIVQIQEVVTFHYHNSTLPSLKTANNQ